MISDLKFQILIEYIEFIHNIYIYIEYGMYIYIHIMSRGFFTSKKNMIVDLHNIGCRQLAGGRKLAYRQIYFAILLHFAADAA